MQLLYRISAFFRRFQDLPGVREEGSPLFRKSNIPLCPVEEFDSQLLFQIMDLAADGGLRHVILLCCVRKIQRLADR